MAKYDTTYEQLTALNTTYAQLTELAHEWLVDLRGHRGQWVLRLKHPETKHFYLYRGENLSTVVARAWAGEPSDRRGSWPWED